MITKMNGIVDSTYNNEGDAGLRALRKRRKNSRRNTGLFLSAAMGCSSKTSSAFSATTRSNVKIIDFITRSPEYPNHLLFRFSDDQDSDERRREHTQAAKKASINLGANNAKNEGMLSRVTKLVPLPKDEDDEVGEYLRFIDRRYHRFHDEIDEVSKGSASSTSPEIGSVGWTWDWLFSTSSPTGKTAQQQHDDALYVLGLADIVSSHAKLRNEIVDNPNTEPDAEAPPPVVSNSNALRDVLLSLALVLRRIFDKQEEQFRIFGRFMRKISFVVASRSVALSRRSITISLDKARRTTLITCALAMIFIRPLMKFLMKTQQ